MSCLIKGGNLASLARLHSRTSNGHIMGECCRETYRVDQAVLTINWLLDRAP